MRGLKDRELKAIIRAINMNDRTLDRVFDEALAYEFSHYPNVSRSIYTPASRSRQVIRDDPMELDVVQSNRTSFFRGGSKSSYNSKPGNNRFSSRGTRNSDLVCEYCNKRGHTESRCFARAEQIIAAAESLKRKGKSTTRSALNVVDHNNSNKDNDNASSYSIDVVADNNDDNNVVVNNVMDNDIITTDICEDDAVITVDVIKPTVTRKTVH
ncbi:hypothetical protein BDF21DRAFT_482360 [Thamnidium elegans]|nr:hypothetical protein BDF21DRAFT_482360 [Thamnidium elegans]